MSAPLLWLAVLAALALGTASCKDERLASSASGGTGGGGTAGSGGKAGSAGATSEVDAGPPIRSVEVRNPLGNTELPDNLFVDGDFELTSSGGQFGWRSLTPGGEAALLRETGGLCRSGVTCGILTADADLMAFGAAARDKPMRVSFWAKPDSADCEAVSASIISCATAFLFSTTAVPPTSPTPGPDAWCRYSAELEPMTEPPCMYLAVRSGTRALIDAAELVATESGSRRVQTRVVPNPELRARMQAALDWLQKNRRF